MKKLFFILSLFLISSCQKEESSSEMVSKPQLISVTIDSTTTETIRVSN